MTDPGRSDPVHLDERRVRNDLSDVFADVLADVVAGAWSAPSCPSLARLTAAVPDGFDTGELTPFQQDEVLDGCHHCGRCVEADRAYDLPQAIVRGQAMRRATGQLRSGERVPRWVVGGGRLGVLGRRVLGAAPGSAWRRVGATVGGLSSIRHLPAPADRPLRSMRPTNDQHRNPLHHTGHRTGQNTGRHQPGRHQHGQHRHDRHDGSLRDVVIVPTCGIDRFAPHVATDLIDLLHRAGVHVAIASEVRCGHAWWEAGDLRRFARMSSDAVETLIPFVDAGAEVVVLEATCHRALLTAAEHVAPSSRSAADRIAARTVGLDRLIGRLDRQFPF
ncbi:MAG: (Fe-S)-binding protein, partial [Actinomycetota bacterium]